MIPVLGSYFRSLPVGFPEKRLALVAPKAFQGFPGEAGKAGGASAVSEK